MLNNNTTPGEWIFHVYPSRVSCCPRCLTASSQLTLATRRVILLTSRCSGELLLEPEAVCVLNCELSSMSSMCAGCEKLKMAAGMRPFADPESPASSLFFTGCDPEPKPSPGCEKDNRLASDDEAEIPSTSEHRRLPFGAFSSGRKDVAGK